MILPEKMSSLLFYTIHIYGPDNVDISRLVPGDYSETIVYIFDNNKCRICLPPDMYKITLNKLLTKI
jgi:hypothetical protein